MSHKTEPGDLKDQQYANIPCEVCVQFYFYEEGEGTCCCVALLSIFLIDHGRDNKRERNVIKMDKMENMTAFVRVFCLIWRCVGSLGKCYTIFI